MARAKSDLEIERWKEAAALREELEKTKDDLRVAQTKIVTYKANEEALEERTRMHEKWFYELERGHEERVKSYEEQIYALAQELKMRKWEIDKIEAEKNDA